MNGRVLGVWLESSLHIGVGLVVFEEGFSAVHGCACLVFLDCCGFGSMSELRVRQFVAP